MEATPRSKLLTMKKKVNKTEQNKTTPSKVIIITKENPTAISILSLE